MLVSFLSKNDQGFCHLFDGGGGWCLSLVAWLLVIEGEIAQIFEDDCGKR